MQISNPNLAPRASTLVWSYLGEFTGNDVWTLGKLPLAISEQGPGVTQSWDDPQFLCSLTVPAGTPMGSYPVNRNGQATGVTINVVAPIVAAPPVVVSSYSDALAAALAGKSITLADGVYNWPASIPLNFPGQSVSGVDRDFVKIRRLPFNAPDPFGLNYMNAAFTSTQQGISLGGFTYDASECPGATVFHSTSNNAGFQFLSARLISAMGPYVSAQGMIVEDIDGINSAMNPGAGTFYNRIGLSGVCEFTNCCIVCGNALLANWLFDGTERGMVMRGTNEAYITGVVCRDIILGNNANELCLFEDSTNTPQINSVISHLFAHGCNGSLFQSGYNVSGIRLMHFEQDGGEGIWLAPDATGCNFQDGELRRTLGIDMGFQAGNRLKDIAIIAPNNTRGNQDLFMNVSGGGNHYGLTKAVRNIAPGDSPLDPATVILRDAAAGWTLT